ncbi:MAG: hypothetical protein P8179_17220, partial [Candidatus Thiodiazotropha sp.]
MSGANRINSAVTHEHPRCGSYLTTSYISFLNGGTEPHPMTFATPSKGRGSLLFKRIVNISLLCGTQGL